MEWLTNFSAYNLERFSGDANGCDGVFLYQGMKSVIYVVVDALSNYITALGYDADDSW